jgi:hypothetical protein
MSSFVGACFVSGDERGGGDMSRVEAPLPGTRKFKLDQAVWFVEGNINTFARISGFMDGRHCRYIGYKPCWAYYIKFALTDGKKTRDDEWVREDQLLELSE